MKMSTMLAFVLTATLWLGSPVAAAELLMFESAGCEWCAAWDRQVGAVYAKTDEGRRLPLRRVDNDGPRPDGLMHIKGIVYTPTFVALEDGREVGRIIGFPGEDFFWSMLEDIIVKLKKPETASRLKEKRS